MRRNLARVAVAASGAIIAALTLTPSAVPGATAPFFCLTCGAWLQDGVDNVLLFAPFGAALAALGLRAGAPLAIAAVSSFVIEFVQHSALPGRDAALADLVSNTVGGALGELAWRTALWWPDPRRARRAVLVLAPLAIIWLAAPTWWFALRDPVGPYWPSLVPAESPQPAPAVLLSARWNGAALTCCPDPEWPALRATYAGRGAEVDIRAVVTGPVRIPGSLLTVWDSSSNVVVGISIAPTGIAGSAATRAQISGVRDPVLWVPASRALHVGDTVDVRLRVTPARWTMAVSSHGSTETRALSPVPSLAPWYLLPGVRRASDSPSWLGRLLMLSPLLVLGWWLGCTRDPRVAVATAVGVPVAAWAVGGRSANPTGMIADLALATLGIGAAACLRLWLTRTRLNSHQ